ncbi:unnamed protein product [Linum trigynum]|uniref:Uncharacterized protein n=1 Tax=Linum trigynum TaxID=586398 RepID=A0AAV2G3N8_9ROSI
MVDRLYVVVNLMMKSSTFKNKLANRTIERSVFRSNLVDRTMERLTRRYLHNSSQSRGECSNDNEPHDCT